MADSEKYIGTPNGIVLCVDNCQGHAVKGRFYHAYSKSAVGFENEDQLTFGMEEFFDSINYPYSANTVRSFAETKRKGKKQVNQDDSSWSSRQLRMNSRLKKREKVMEDQELLNMHGDMGSFIVRVQNRQNSSMQGRITWVEKNKTIRFRSAWEMIRLINSAIDIDKQKPEDGSELPSWE